MNATFVPALRGGRSALDRGQKVQQDRVHVGRSFELRAMARRLDDGRSPVRELIGDLLCPAGWQQLVASAFDHQRRDRDAFVGSSCSTVRAVVRHPDDGSEPRRAPPTRRERCWIRTGARRRPRRPDTSGRGRAPRRSAAWPAVWRRSRRALPCAGCAGSRRRHRWPPGCASAAPATPRWRRRAG